MKKLLSIIFAVAMIATLSVTAFAADPTPLTNNPATGLNGGSYSIGVNATYVAGQAAADVISVDISWESLSFEYYAPSGGTWQADTHTYVGKTEGAWSTNKPGINFVNHSNVDIFASYKFDNKPGAFYSTFAFYSRSEEPTAPGGDYEYTEINRDEQTFVLLAAEEGTAFPEEITIYGGIKAVGYIPAEFVNSSGDCNIGTITINIRSYTTKVSTKEELQAAADAGDGKIVLLNDIDMGSNALSITRNIELDLNGHKLTSSNSNWGTVYTYNKLVVKNGTIESTSTANYGYVVRICDGSNSSGTFENCTITSISSRIEVGAPLTLKDCTINGNDKGGDAIKLTTFSGASSTPSLTMSGDISIDGNITRDADSMVITANPGTYYNFDPTAYVDTERFVVIDYDTCYVVKMPGAD